MRRELIIVVVLLAALSTACGKYKDMPIPIIPGSSSTPAPPLATLTIAGEEQIAELTGYCWRHEDGRPMCSGAPIGIRTAQEALLTESPFVARLWAPIEQPMTGLLLEVIPATDDDQFESTAQDSRVWRPDMENSQRFPLATERETSVDLSLEPGLYVLSLSAGVQGMGDASYGFLVEVRYPQQ